ncbi:MAG: type 2 isopentenyl-diphosphate Delta-isomerase [Acholeplasmataceae bacterium]
MSKNRKDDHIKLALLQTEKLNSFDKVKLIGTDLPDLSIDDINLETTYLGFKIPYPIYINAMTGGIKKALEINEYLAKLANHFNLPFVTGSQSIAIKNEESIPSFKIIRKYHQGILVGNLNPNYNYKDAIKAIKMIKADALSIHLNVIQELIMKEGDRDFKRWSKNIKEINEKIEIPLVIKQVGMGLSNLTIQKLKTLGIKYIDVSGSGGTSFIEIESKRSNQDYYYLKDFEIDTADILLSLQNEIDLEVYASGGIRNPLDVIKSLVLGAKAVGLSSFFLKLTKNPIDRSIEIINNFLNDLKKIMLILGVSEIKDLKAIKYNIK